MAFKELDSEGNIKINSAVEATKDNIKMNETKIKEVQDEPIELEPKNIVAPLYENVFYHNSADDGAAFALDLPTNVLEPPKEKPPPPPTDDNPEDDELLGNVSIFFFFSIINAIVMYKAVVTSQANGSWDRTHARTS